MKKMMLILALVVLGCGPQAVQAANKTKLSWTAPTTNMDGTPLTDLGGYKVYCGPSSRVYTVSKDVGNVLEYLILGVVSKDGTYFCAATAYDTTGNESAYSNEVSFTLDYTAPNPPGGIVPKITINSLEAGALTVVE